MARKQTRRAVSLRPASYDLVKAFCLARGLSMSSFIEERTAEFFTGIQRHVDDEPVEPPPPPTPPVEEEEEPTKPFTQSGLVKEKPQPYKKPPIRGGGVHEL